MITHCRSESEASSWLWMSGSATFTIVMSSRSMNTPVLRGARYLHVLVPCPLGWSAAPADTIRVARMATQSGLFPVFEAEHGEVTSVSRIRRRVPVEEYLSLQGRFAHLFGAHPRPDLVARIQAGADLTIERFGLLPEDDRPDRESD